MESGVRNRTKNLLLFEIRKGEACPGLVRVGALAASLGGWRDGLLLAQLLKPGVGVEKVTSISGMRIGTSMLEESIYLCSVGFSSSEAC